MESYGRAMDRPLARGGGAPARSRSRSTFTASSVTPVMTREILRLMLTTDKNSSSESLHSDIDADDLSVLRFT